ncbi:hypothetical protein I4U23_005922 [Adineta vaga]|nr:hypothetical protein I4U23_005922 [Adineta vaga]
MPTTNRSTTRIMSEADIELAQLKNLSANNENESEYWYHATSWKKAKRIMRMGPRISKGPSDLANRGAFYLNPSHDDCYSWFATKDSSFKGRHAMLIYKFDLEILSSNGKRLDDKGKWKNLVTERSKCSSPCKEDWIYTYQNSNPSSVNKSGNNVKARSMQNGEPAMQLIICQERMCRNIHKCLVGCVFYKKLN